jgi:AraC-like DNA-binding protein
MPGGGTRTFLDPERYEASLRYRLIETIITSRGPFKARMTWTELHQLQLLRCEEDGPRIAYLSFASQPVFVAFPILFSPSPVWGGTAMQGGEILFPSRGERLHQMTSGRCVWGVIAVDPLQLENHRQDLYRTPISPPPAGKILRPAPRDAARLRRLHAQACRLAETKSKMLTHPEVARAIEQGLIHALSTCLSAPEARPDAEATARHARIMIRFEEILADHLTRPLRMPDLCRLIGVSIGTLRTSCAEFLGVTPGRYVLLRRLRQARVALRTADAARSSVADLARACGFTQPGRFVAAYRAAFGSSPFDHAQTHSRTNFSGG